MYTRTHESHVEPAANAFFNENDADMRGSGIPLEGPEGETDLSPLIGRQWDIVILTYGGEKLVPRGGKWANRC